MEPHLDQPVGVKINSSVKDCLVAVAEHQLGSGLGEEGGAKLKGGGGSRWVQPRWALPEGFGTVMLLSHILSHLSHPKKKQTHVYCGSPECDFCLQSEQRPAPPRWRPRHILPPEVLANPADLGPVHRHDVVLSAKQLIGARQRLRVRGCAAQSSACGCCKHTMSASLRLVAFGREDALPALAHILHRGSVPHPQFMRCSNHTRCGWRGTASICGVRVGQTLPKLERSAGAKIGPDEVGIFRRLVWERQARLARLQGGKRGCGKTRIRKNMGALVQLETTNKLVWKLVRPIDHRTPKYI